MVCVILTSIVIVTPTRKEKHYYQHISNMNDPLTIADHLEFLIKKVNKHDDIQQKITDVEGYIQLHKISC